MLSSKPSTRETRIWVSHEEIVDAAIAKIARSVYHVLLHLRASLSPGDFFHLLDDSIAPNLTPAVNLLQVYAKQGDRQLLRDFYYQDDRRTESACLEMGEASSSQVS